MLLIRRSDFISNAQSNTTRKGGGSQDTIAVKPWSSEGGDGDHNAPTLTGGV
jgi:hypothetical protein